MKISEMYAVSRFFTAADVTQPRILSIRKVSQETLRDKGLSVVIDFEGESRRLILNKVNAQTCGRLLGDDTADWPGQQVELYAEPTEFDGKKTMGVRVRKPGVAAAVLRLPVPFVNVADPDEKQGPKSLGSESQLPIPQAFTTQASVLGDGRQGAALKRVCRAPKIATAAVQAPPADYPTEA